VARTRAQRRRRTLLISIALVVTLIVLVFARDVSRAGHGAITARRSENRSFAALANTLLSGENLFDGRLDRLLVQGGSLSRVVFAARLEQLNEQLPAWSVAADQLRTPKLAHDVNATLDELTQSRVTAYQSLLADVARTLSLPWSTVSTQSSARAAATLIATSVRWNHDRYALAKEPGTVRLLATSAVSAQYVAQHGTSDLTQSSSLRLVRAISIAALRVVPAPLPAATGVMLLPPVTSVQLGVSVLNASYDEQPVVLTIQVTPLNHLGDAFVQRMSATLGPDQAFAFVPKALGTAASESARVVIRVSGARAAVGKTTVEVFHLEMSPSGNVSPG
jgi:hypothetical protein